MTIRETGTAGNAATPGDAGSAGVAGHARKLHVARGTAADAQYALDIDPARAGWDYSSLRVVELEPGGSHTFTTGDSEWIVLPLQGACSVQTQDQQGQDEKFHLSGRESVFAGVSDFAYVPRDARAQIASGAGGRFALAGAKCERQLPARYGPAPEDPVEERGSGLCTRHVRNFASADAFDCDKLIAVEVVTPGGNWSSYPPHKHDRYRPGEEAELEEIYYFEIDGPGGFGYQRVSPSRAGGADVLAEVRSGDAVLVPDGWHGPSIAQPGHDMYYLNVMAGPGEERAWRICFHPDHTEGYR
jgi:5-deoxy-glucuronate isomerase